MTKDWELVREAIIEEYKTRNRPLREVQQLMEQKYNFKASIRAYRSRFDRWGLTKYTRRKRSHSTGALDAEDCQFEEDGEPPTESGAMTRFDEPSVSIGYGSRRPFIKTEPSYHADQLPMSIQSPAEPQSRFAHQFGPHHYNSYHQQNFGYTLGSESFYPHGTDSMTFSAPVSPNHSTFSAGGNQVFWTYSSNVKASRE